MAKSKGELEVIRQAKMLKNKNTIQDEIHNREQG